MLLSHLNYLYDRINYNNMCNRIAKHVWKDETWERSTYYILDAQGNQISTYDHEVVNNTVQFNLKERNIFGSSRIGSKQDSLNVLTATITQNYSQTLGNKYFEFSNHLGNVLTVFSDLKIPKDTDNNNVVDEYEIGVVSIADYSPFGVELDGRTESGGGYRYGFNGQEKTDELSGSGNHTTATFWEYSSRIGRRWNTDPVVKEYISPYACFGNNPIFYADPNGDDWYENKNYDKSKEDKNDKSTHKYQWFQGSDEKEGFNKIGAYLVTKHKNNVNIKYQNISETNAKMRKRCIHVFIKPNDFNLANKQTQRAESQGVAAISVNSLTDLMDFSKELDRNNVKIKTLVASNHHDLLGNSFSISMGNCEFGEMELSKLSFLQKNFATHTKTSFVIYACGVIHPDRVSDYLPNLQELSSIVGAEVYAPMFLVPDNHLYNEKARALNLTKKQVEKIASRYTQYSYSQLQPFIENNGNWIKSNSRNSQKIKNLNIKSGQNITYDKN